MGHIKRKNKVDPGAQILQLLKENHEERNKQRKDLLEMNKNRDDGDVMFMMSFVPNLRQLDPVEKCEVKSQISKLFLDMEKKKYAQQQYTLATPNLVSTYQPAYTPTMPAELTNTSYTIDGYRVITELT